jgi:hypothetical protein
VTVAQFCGSAPSPAVIDGHSGLGSWPRSPASSASETFGAPNMPALPMLA